MYQEYTLSRAQVQVKQLEKLLSQQNQTREMDLSAMRGEISSLMKVRSELCWRLLLPDEGTLRALLEAPPPSELCWRLLLPQSSELCWRLLLLSELRAQVGDELHTRA